MLGRVVERVLAREINLRGAPMSQESSPKQRGSAFGIGGFQAYRGSRLSSRSAADRTAGLNRDVGGNLKSHLSLSRIVRDCDVPLAEGA